MNTFTFASACEQLFKEQVRSDNDASEVGILGHLGTFWDNLGHFGTIRKTF